VGVRCNFLGLLQGLEGFFCAGLLLSVKVHCLEGGGKFVLGDLLMTGKNTSCEGLGPCTCHASQV
jgi:hypothetical protein